MHPDTGGFKKQTQQQRFTAAPQALGSPASRRMSLKLSRLPMNQDENPRPTTRPWASGCRSTAPTTMLQYVSRRGLAP